MSEAAEAIGRTIGHHTNRIQSLEKVVEELDSQQGEQAQNIGDLQDAIDALSD